jgi:hypothetical protein
MCCSPSQTLPVCLAIVSYPRRVCLATSGEPVLVAGAAKLLSIILTHNSAALAKLYQTGLFFFALAYLGSNLTEVAALLKVSAPRSRCHKSDWPI